MKSPIVEARHAYQESFKSLERQVNQGIAQAVSNALTCVTLPRSWSAIVQNIVKYLYEKDYFEDPETLRYDRAFWDAQWEAMHDGDVSYDEAAVSFVCKFAEKGYDIYLSATLPHSNDGHLVVVIDWSNFRIRNVGECTLEDYDRATLITKEQAEFLIIADQMKGVL